jgi:L-ascorbate metabolism protein UlaG (beta-lactamase superfamily)
MIIIADLFIHFEFYIILTSILFITNFATDSFIKILSEARKYKLNLTMANQYMAQIPLEVQKAIHPQSAYPVGFLVKGDGLAVYHAGDTYSFTDMARIKCDVALVPIGGGQVMDPFAANSIVKEMRPKVAVPMHYNTYEKLEQDPNEFVTDLGGLTKGVALRVGQELRI